jgi:ornithine lipid ester-linked acyl 2-hydroxylase
MINLDRAVSSLERVMALTSNGNRTFFDVERFTWVREIEAEWKLVRAELDSLLLQREKIPNFQDLSPEQQVLTEGDQWKAFVLYGFGHEVEQNCARCPETARLVGKIPGMQTAMFSILAPKKHIPGHRGVYKGLLRYHLGLIVPEPQKCRILVGKEIRHWQEGKSLVFDDSYWHEAWNDSDQYRVVLFVDFVRPLPFPLSVLNRMIIRRFSTLQWINEGVERARQAPVIDPVHSARSKQSRPS